MKKQKPIENLVIMHQAEKKAKKFRKDYPVSDKLRVEMVNEVFSDFMFYVLDNYYDEENLSMFEEFLEDRNKEEKRVSLLNNLFWWKAMYKTGQKQARSLIEEYITLNFNSFRSNPFMTSWLKECDKSVSKFYYIGHKYNDRYFVAVDVLTHKPLNVLLCEPTATSPKQGGFVTGTLLPLGGDLYFPIVDFYHFDYEAREAIASCIHHHYDKYLKQAPLQDAFLHVLSVMLQIERIISMTKINKVSE